ncbi:hypothetical protein FA95DRAFT_425626 [Auriscalpium vulgare]|uniref:Uncharacterized protein n=1 Tax=Auriscalpium vulgare TaxID=40419 RepID=A0ACB8S4R3_9AGAM|nr:hypothetical protein FA95DRAFT_425626 [Auriscalpium vulgare]
MYRPHCLCITTHTGLFATNVVLCERTALDCFICCLACSRVHRMYLALELKPLCSFVGTHDEQDPQTVSFANRYCAMSQSRHLPSESMQLTSSIRRYEDLAPGIIQKIWEIIRFEIQSRHWRGGNCAEAASGHGYVERDRSSSG